MTKSFSQKLTDACLRFWPAILIVSIFLSIAGLKPTIYLFKNISTDAADLLPTHQSNVLTLLQMRKKFEKGERSRTLIESDNRDANIRFVEDFARMAAQQPFISKVRFTKPGFEYFDKAKLLFLSMEDLTSIRDRLEKKITKEKMLGLYFDLEEEPAEEKDLNFSDLENKYKSEFMGNTYSPYNESADGRIFFVTLDALPGKTGISEAAAFEDKVKNFLSTLKPTDYDPTMKVYIHGELKVAEYFSLMKDLRVVGIISAILIFLPLLIRFRNPFHVLWVFLPLFVGIPISFAVASFFVPKLNLCTSFLFAILGALGIENGIHIFSRYYESRVKGASLNEGLLEIFARTARSVVVSVVSVAATFLILVINEFRGFSEFGLITGIGLMVIFLVYFSFFPALLVFLDKYKWLRFRERTEQKTSKVFLSGALVSFVFYCGLALSAYSIWTADKVQFEHDSRKTRAVIPELDEVRKKQKLVSYSANNPAGLILENAQEAKEVKAAVTALIEGKKTKLIDNVSTYADIIPKDQERKIKVIAQIGKLLEDKAFKFLDKNDLEKVNRFKEAVHKTALVSEKDIPENISFLFFGKSEVPGEVLYIKARPELELDDGRNAMAFADDIGTLKVGGKTYHPANDALVYGVVLKTMLGDAPRVMVLAFLLLCFFVYLDFRNIRHTAMVVASILFGVVWMLCLMQLWGVKINFYNMIIIPAVFGMSIDNSIHIFHRYRELGRGSLSKVMATAGQSALLASLTNASAFIALLFCNHRGLFSIGLLAVIGVGTCLFSTLVFFPAMLAQIEKWTAPNQG